MYTLLELSMADKARLYSYKLADGFGASFSLKGFAHLSPVPDGRRFTTKGWGTARVVIILILTAVYMIVVPPANVDSRFQVPAVPMLAVPRGLNWRRAEQNTARIFCG